MSIRNRVMLATLGLAVVGFVVTLGAQDDKVLIVRDGSVDLSVINSNLDRRKEEEKKHKWSKKADSVQVFEDASFGRRRARPVRSAQSKFDKR